MKRSPQRSALLIALAYTTVAGLLCTLWFYLGDRVLESPPGPTVHWQWHVVQDWGLCLLTGALLFMLARRTLGDLARAHHELEARVQQRTGELAEANETLRAEVAERKRVEEALSRSEFKFRTVSDFTWDWEFWMGPDGRMLYVSPSCERISGYRADEFCASPHLLLDIVHPEDRASLSAALERSLVGETHHGLDYRITARDGSSRWVSVALNPVTTDGTAPSTVRGSIRDITERLAGEEERARLWREVDANRSLLQAVFDNVPAGIAIFDGATLDVRWANPAYRLFLEEPHRTGDIAGLPIDEIIPGATEIGLADIFRRVASTGEPHVEPEYEYRGFARGITYWQWVLLPLRTEASPQPGLLLLTTEITEQVVSRRRLELRALEFAALLEISGEVASTLQLQPLLGVILDRLKVLVDYTGAAMFVPQGDNLAIVEYRGPLPTEQVRCLTLSEGEAPVYQTAKQTRAPVIVPDILGDTELARDYRQRASPRILQTLGDSRSVMVVPLLVQNRVTGMLRLDALAPNFFTPHHAELALAIANQAAIALENARLYEDAQRTAALEERQRLARDLHDSVSQALYGIVLGAHAVRKMVRSNPDEVEQTLGYVLGQAEAAVAEMRALIFELRPETLAREGLAAALSRQVAAARARYGVEIRAELCQEPSLPVEAKQALFRIAQEALHNALKHAQPTLVELSLAGDACETLLTVRDNGAGFDPSEAYPGHMGLQSMRERAQRLGAALEIDSRPGSGTVLQLRLTNDAVAYQAWTRP